MDNEDFIRFLTSRARVHEAADEGWKAAVARGVSEPVGDKAELVGHIDGLTSEVSELRGRLAAMQASLDALLERTPLE